MHASTTVKRGPRDTFFRNHETNRVLDTKEPLIFK